MTTDAFAGDPATVIAATWARWDGYQGHNERDVFGMPVAMTRSRMLTA